MASTDLSTTDSSSGDAPFILLLIPMATIFLIYAYLLFLTIRNIIRIRRISQAIKFGKAFYLLILLALVARVISYALMVIGMISYYNSDDAVNDLFTKGFLSLTYVPDIFATLSFFIYGWLVLILFLLGLIQLSNTNLLSMTSKNGYFMIWIISLVSLEVAQFACFFLYWFREDIFPFGPYIILNSCVNLVQAFLIAAAETVIHFTFSGIPFKADFHQKRFKRMNYILLFWGFGCAFKGVINILQSGTLPTVWEAFIKETTTPITSVIAPILLILQIFISEIVPLLLVNDSKIINDLFVKREYSHVHHNASVPSNPSLMEHLLKANTLSSVGTDEVVYGGQRLPGSKENRQKVELEDSIIVDQKRVAISEKEDPTQKEILGSFYDAQYNEEKIKARVIKVKKITPYLAEEINREVNKFIRFKNPYILKVRGCSLEEPEVTIYYEYVERGSLHEILHLRQKSSEKLDHVFKLKVAIQIAEGLKYLHNRENKVVHGHLHPLNIWLDKDYVVKIMDYGFANLKKYASIMGKYSNISQYTAPEVLSAKGKSIPDDPSIDIYSFGMILWELLTEQVPFDELGTRELQQLVCEDNSRPKIPNSVPETLQNLIRACWQQDAQKRPQIEEVIEVLEEELEQS